MFFGISGTLGSKPGYSTFKLRFLDIDVAHNINFFIPDFNKYQDLLCKV